MKEVLVVEGLHDQDRLQAFDPTIDCIVTNGSEISPFTLDLIKRAQTLRGVILLLDPDHPGKKITQTILQIIPDAKVAFLDKQDAISKNKKKVGVEHATDEALRKALSSIRQEQNNTNYSVITAQDFFRLALTGSHIAKKNRQRISEAFQLPPSNAKALRKWLNLFQISLSDIEEVLKCQN